MPLESKLSRFMQMEGGAWKTSDNDGLLFTMKALCLYLGHDGEIKEFPPFPLRRHSTNPFRQLTRTLALMFIGCIAFYLKKKMSFSTLLETCHALRPRSWRDNVYSRESWIAFAVGLLLANVSPVNSCCFTMCIQIGGYKRLQL